MKCSLISLLFSAFVSLAVAQQGDYGGRYDDGGYRDYAGGRDDNVYVNYANKAAVARGGWKKVVLAGVAGYFLGAKIHTSRLSKSVPKLRFKAKQRVKCNMGSSGWMKGTVVRLWSQQAKGDWVPYEVRLDNGGGVVFAPQDDDMIIRALSPAVKA